MNPPTNFLSALADRFSDYVTFRRLGGVDSHSQILLLRYFDRFLYQQGFRGQWPAALTKSDPLVLAKTDPHREQRWRGATPFSLAADKKLTRGRLGGSRA